MCDPGQGLATVRPQSLFCPLKGLLRRLGALMAGGYGPGGCSHSHRRPPGQCGPGHLVPKPKEPPSIVRISLSSHTPSQLGTTRLLTDTDLPTLHPPLGRKGEG